MFLGEYVLNRVKNRQIWHSNHCQQGSLHVWDRILRNCRLDLYLRLRNFTDSGFINSMSTFYDIHQIYTSYYTLYWNTYNNCKPPVVNIGLDHPIHQEIDWTYLNLEALKVLCFTSLLCSRTSCCCVHGSGYWSCWAFFMDTEPWGWLSWKMRHADSESQQRGKWVMSQTKDINKSTKESIRFHATVLKSIIYLWTLTFLIGDVFPCRHPKRLAQ